MIRPLVVIAILITAAAAAATDSTPTPTPISVRPTKEQQACVNEMNKSGETVNKVRLAENERCMTDFQREKLVTPMTFGSCSSADRRGRMQKAGERTQTREVRKCDGLDEPPPFAYSHSATVNAAAVTGSSWLTQQIFGSPSMMDTGLATKASDPDAAKCQLEVLKRTNKLESTVLNELVKEKKRALKDETVDNGSALAERLAQVYGPNARIERARGALLYGAARRCAGVEIPLADIFAGHCGDGDPNISAVAFCAIVAAHCAACETLNTFDDLNLDCDQLDDGIANGSCSALE